MNIREAAGGDCVLLNVESPIEPAPEARHADVPSAPSDVSSAFNEEEEEQEQEDADADADAAAVPIQQPAAQAIEPLVVLPSSAAASVPRNPWSRRLPTFVLAKGSMRWAGIAVAVCAIVEAFVIAALLAPRGNVRPAATVTEVTLMTPDPGAAVTVNGQSAGVTPLQLTIGPEMRLISVASPRPPAPKQELVVGSTGQQRTVLENGREPVRADPRSGPVSTAAPAPRVGGIRVSSPIELEVFEGDTRLGSTAAGILSAAAGRHEFDLVNSALGFKSRQVVQIKAGLTVPLTVSPPNGSININAVPWAEVLIDGKSIGETPIGNFSIPLGEHEITFRHPQLGEVRRTAVVRADAVTRVSANLER